MIIKLLLVLIGAGLFSLPWLIRLGLAKRVSAVGQEWRPSAGVLGLLFVILGLIFAARSAWWEAGLAGLCVCLLALSARKPRAKRPQAAPPSAEGMNREDAARILGVAPSASPETVREAYMRLMRRIHPDMGGTAGLAAQLNRARDVLLSGRPAP